jgi:cell migration-inducing and hyaluronan-binding protein
MLDRHIATNNTFGVTGNMHIAFENPADTRSKIVEQVFENLTAYKNRNGGFWGRGEMRTYINIKSADNAIGYTQASGLRGGASLEDPYTSRVIDSLFVGETENIGNPVTPEEKAYGRSVPKRELPDFPTRGYEYYDSRHDVVNTTFRNFEDNATRKTGAFSYLLYTSFGVSSNNAFERVKFENAKPAYFPPMERKWANDNGNSQAYRTSVIRDKDGSLGAGPNAYILIHDGVNDSIATDPVGCEIKPTWNAAVCKGDVGRLNVSAGGAAGGRGAPGGPGAAKGGPGGPGAAKGGPALAGGPGAAKGPAGPGAAKGGPGAAKGGPGGGAPAQPIVLSRNGKDYTQAGNNVRAGTEIKVTTEQPSVSLRLTELDKGSWVIFQLPGFNTAAAGTQQSSLDALRQASDTSYFKDKDALWVKVVSPDSGPLGLGGGTTLTVSR